MTCVHSALERHDLAHQKQIKALEQRISQLERQLAAQAIRPVAGQSKTQPKSSKRLQEQRGVERQPARAELKLPEVSAPLDPLATRIHRRLALVETVIRWRRQADSSVELVHHGAGMGVVYGVAGDLVIPRRLADPWVDDTLRSQRELAQQNGGSASVLFRIWGSGLAVLGSAGTVNAQNAMVFDQPLRTQRLGDQLVRLQNVGFPGEESARSGAPQQGETVLGFRWPAPMRAGLPERTNPVQTELAFGVMSPSCIGCALFDTSGQLVGHVDGIGVHEALPGLGTP